MSRESAVWFNPLQSGPTSRLRNLDVSPRDSVSPLLRCTPARLVAARYRCSASGAFPST